MEVKSRQVCLKSYHSFKGRKQKWHSTSSLPARHSHHIFNPAVVGFWVPVLESGSEIGFNVSSSEKLATENSRQQHGRSPGHEPLENDHVQNLKETFMNLSTYVPNLKRIRSVYPCSLGWLGCKSASSTFSWSHRSSIHLLHVWWCLWCQAIPQVYNSRSCNCLGTQNWALCFF